MKLKNCKFRIVNDRSQLAFVLVELILWVEDTIGLIFKVYAKPAVGPVCKEKKGNESLRI